MSTAARFPLLLVCFFASGFAALLYETAWTREFGFVFGTSELAVAAVLAAYMAGLALGAALASRLAPRMRRPVLVYGVLELLIAAGALAVPFAIGVVRNFYLGLLGGLDAPPETVGTATALFHLAGAFVVLVPCTALMGATLPLLARYAVRSDEQVGPRVGLLYAVNTAGAIGGTLCAAFWLLPALGLRDTVYVGAAANALVFAAAAALARGAAPPPPLPVRHALRHRWMLPLIGISGAISFSYEVLWVRLLSHVLGGSTAAFSTMLASFLLGIALGSAIAARFARSRAAALRGFAFAQIGTALFAVLSFPLANELPRMAQALGASAQHLAPGILLAATVLLPMTLCIGATFPFAVRAVSAEAADASTASARVYAWNTLGSIIGSVGAGFVLMPLLGLEGTIAAGAALNALLAAATFALSQPRRKLAAGFLGVAALAVWWLPLEAPEKLLRTSALTGQTFSGEIAYVGIGRSATVTLIDDGHRYRVVTNGLPEAGIDRPENPPRATLARWLSLAPVLYRPDTASVLVIGLGGGVTLGAVPSSVGRIDLIELEPHVLAANRHIEARRGGQPLDDPRVHVHQGDARGALILSNARYDAIVSQPSHPWTSGSAHLYTREFFQLAASRLEPGGVFVQWIGLAFASEAQFRSLLATLRDTFGHVEVLQPLRAGVLFVASDAALDLPAAAVEALRRAAPDDYIEEGLTRIEDVLAAWRLDDAATRALAEGAPLSTDDENRLATRESQFQASSWQDRLFPPRDPLRSHHAFSPAALAQRLLARRQMAQGPPIAESLPPLERETMLGWLAALERKPRAALRHFDDADALRPAGVAQSEDLRLGRLLLDPESVSHPGWSAREQALITARGLDAAEAVAPLEPLLAQWQRGDLLYVDALRERIRWRLAAGDAARALEALALVDDAIRIRPQSSDLLDRAQAGLQAGKPAVAWASLVQARRGLAGPSNRAASRRALEIARQLPADRRSRLLMDTRAAAGDH